jgi:hypothetical protein
MTPSGSQTMKRSISAEMLLAMLSDGRGNPETKRLAVGARAFLVDHDSFNGTAQHKIYLWGGARPGVNALVQGTHVMVVDDEADREHDWGTRKVRVHVEDGEYRGKTGVVVRHDLHPE